MYPNQYQPNQNVHQLPHNPTEPETQGFNWTLDNPPIMPNIPCPQNIRYLVPAVISTVANVLTQECRRNVGRMFTYNLMARANFNNQEFMALATLAVDFLALNHYRGLYQSHPDQGVSRAAADAVAYFTSINYQQYQQLASMTDAKTLQDANNTVLAGNNEMQAVQQFKNTMTQGQQVQMPYVQQGMMPQQGYAPQQMHMNNTPRPGPSQGQGMQQVAALPPNASLFSNGNAATPFNQPVGLAVTQGSDKYSYLKKAVVEQVQPQPAQTIRHQPVQTIEEKPSTWTPSEEQPYPLVIDTTKGFFDLKFATSADGQRRFPISYRNNEGTEDMNREQHQIKTDVGRINYVPPTHWHTREPGEVQMRVADSLIAATRFNENDKLADVPYSDGRWLTEMFLDQAIYITSYKHADQKQTHPAMQYRQNAYIATPYLVEAGVSSEEERQTNVTILEQTIEEMSQLIDFAQVEAWLRLSIDGPESTKSSRAFAFKLNAHLTKELNSVLANKLSLSGLSINSFLEDALDLEPYLAQAYGDVWASAFREYEPLFIQKHIRGELPYENSMDDMRELAAFDDRQVDAVFITSAYSITRLDIFSADLNIECLQNQGSAILESELPLLHRMAKSILATERLGKIPFAHHLIVTADEKIYEIHKGLIGKDYILISNYN